MEPVLHYLMSNNDAHYPTDVPEIFFPKRGIAIDANGQLNRCNQPRSEVRHQRILASAERFRAIGLSEDMIRREILDQPGNKIPKDPKPGEVPISLGDEVEKAAVLMESAERAIDKICITLFVKI